MNDLPSEQTPAAVPKAEPKADGVIYRPKTAAKIRVGPEATRPLPLPKTAPAEPVKPATLTPGSLTQRQLLVPINGYHHTQGVK